MNTKPEPKTSPSRAVQAVGCLAYPVGFGIVVALALLIKSMV